MQDLSSLPTYQAAACAAAGYVHPAGGTWCVVQVEHAWRAGLSSFGGCRVLQLQSKAQSFLCKAQPEQQQDLDLSCVVQVKLCCASRHLSYEDSQMTGTVTANSVNALQAIAEDANLCSPKAVSLDVKSMPFYSWKSLLIS